MKKTTIMTLVLAASFLCQMDVSTFPSFQTAFAKPPDWAPAHGYRRKHKDKYDKHDHDDYHDNDDHDDSDVRRVIVVNRYEEIFYRLDINRDGRISRTEWEEGDSLFDRLDKNHDGVLSRNEYEGIDEERGFLSGLLYKVKDKLASLWDKLW